MTSAIPILVINFFSNKREAGRVKRLRLAPHVEQNLAYSLQVDPHFEHGVGADKYDRSPTLL